MTESWEEEAGYEDRPGTDWRAIMAILSLVVGALGVTMTCCIPPLPMVFGIGGGVMGILGLQSGQRGLSIAGIVLNTIVVLGNFVLLALLILMFAAEGI